MDKNPLLGVSPAMRHALYRLLLVVLLIPSLTACVATRQMADPSFDPPVPDPAYPKGIGPLVLIDEAHNNFHTADGRYQPFRRLLEKDGYVVRPLTVEHTNESLKEAYILVISNPLADKDLKKWELPAVSSFDRREIAAIEKWVSEGGSLLLIADHMPFPGAASDLAAAFGVLFSNGFAGMRGFESGDLIFRASDGTLGAHAITQGRNSTENVDSVMTFTGQAFRAEVNVSPLLILPPGTELLMPVTSWEFSKKTPRLPATGMLQGAVLRHGEGRVAVFGEAAMFTTQVVVRGEERLREFGMNVPEARANVQFLLNVMHWLSGMLPESPPLPTQ